MLFDELTKRGCDFLGVKYPIIAGAMTWVSALRSAELDRVAKVIGGSHGQRRGKGEGYEARER